MKPRSLILSLLLTAAAVLTSCSGDLKVTVTNSSTADRTCETIEINAADITSHYPDGFIITDAAGSEIPYQITHDNLLIFQTDIPAGTTATFTFAEGTPAPVDTICFAQTRPDCQDDFAWENDRSGYRLYGPSYRAGGGAVKGYDLWTKSVSRPVLAQRYHGDKVNGISYHVDHGDGMDPYTVGPTLGAGMNALMIDGEVFYPWCYRDVEILDNGPLRLTARLSCYPEVIGCDTVTETRVIQLDRGSWLNKTTVTYDGLSVPASIATGIVVHAQNPQAYAIADNRRVISYTDLTDNPDNGNGEIYIGVVNAATDSAFYRSFAEPAGDALGEVITVSAYTPGTAFTYYWGSGWSKGGMPGADAWNDYLLRQADTVILPVEPELSQAGIGIKDIFQYIIGLGAAVMMPIIFTILGLCIGIKLGDALKSGLKVGVGFIGLSIVTALLTSALGPALEKVVGIYDLQLQVFDMGWPAAASVAYNTAVGAFIIPVCLCVNLLMLFTKTTRTVNIDLWNYWHFAFIGAVVYFASDSIAWGFFAAIICYIITLVIADITAKRFQRFYEGMDGISIPQPFCAGFVPFAYAINKGLDCIPGMNRLEIDAEGLKRKFGVMGEPLFLGVVVGIGIGCLTCHSWSEIVDHIPYILGLGIKMGAVMELIPRVTVLFIEGLKPISDATRSLIARKFKGADGLNIGMSPALVIGHPTTLVVSLLLIPFTLLLAVILPGNEFLPLASLAGMFYVFPLVLPFTKGNVLKTFIIGLIVIVIGLLMVTDMSGAFTQAAADVYAQTGDAAVAIPEGFSAGSLDFASSPLSWIIYKLTNYPAWRWIGAGILILLTMAMVIWNRIHIIRNQRAMAATGATETETTE